MSAPSGSVFSFDVSFAVPGQRPAPGGVSFSYASGGMVAATIVDSLVYTSNAVPLMMTPDEFRGVHYKYPRSLTAEIHGVLVLRYETPKPIEFRMKWHCDSFTPTRVSIEIPSRGAPTIRADPSEVVEYLSPLIACLFSSAGPEESMQRALCLFSGLVESCPFAEVAPDSLEAGASSIQMLVYDMPPYRVYREEEGAPATVANRHSSMMAAPGVLVARRLRVPLTGENIVVHWNVPADIPGAVSLARQ